MDVFVTYDSSGNPRYAEEETDGGRHLPLDPEDAHFLLERLQDPRVQRIVEILVKDGFYAGRNP